MDHAFSKTIVLLFYAYLSDCSKTPKGNVWNEVRNTQFHFPGKSSNNMSNFLQNINSIYRDSNIKQKMIYQNAPTHGHKLVRMQILIRDELLG